MTKRWQLPKAKRVEIDEDERLLKVAIKDLEQGMVQKKEAIQALQEQQVILNDRLVQARRALLKLQRDYPTS